MSCYKTLGNLSLSVAHSDNSTSEENDVQESSSSSSDDEVELLWSNGDNENVSLASKFSSPSPSSDNEHEADWKPSAIQTEKELTFPIFDGLTINFHELFISVKNELLRASCHYLLTETVMNGINCNDSKAVEMELSNVLMHEACKLFVSTPSHISTIFVAFKVLKCFIYFGEN